jgi:LmbE family N-acetylglucosaminyl deacetylase
MSKKILILCPHPDDAEFACGGSIAKYSEKGYEIHYLVFSKCVKSLPGNLPENTLFDELYDASEILGVKKECVHTFDFPVRDFPAYRQDILEILIQKKKEIKPSLVFLPEQYDVHQDHSIIHQEGVRAFKTDASILGYELPWNNVYQTKLNFFVSLSETHIEMKLKAIKCYKSQIFREYMNPELFKNFVRLRGAMVNKQYAEAFNVVRWIEP